ncbi:YveK family protein [Clostridium perfringens]|uniref:YveK family protein n=1 Tax=Clostridium perfringens TaxID=1502 RepID=UPI0018E3FF23|nr:Wzz/FepE/Etk N-terminal domain-containing protein [Clostridium perfringens]MBI6011103.1 capsular biosynthesis protein [Clostridium perfringens]
MEENNISLQEFIYDLKRRWKLIVLITIATTLVSAILSFFVIKPQYEAKTKLFIGKQELEGSTYSSSDISMYQQLVKTYAELVKTSDLVNKAVRNANLDLNQNEIKGILNNLNANPSSDTQILELSFIGKDPQMTLKVIEAITDEFISESKELIPNGNVQVIQKPQLPESPINTNKKRNIIIAFVLGIVIGIGLALLLECLDNTFKSREELEKTLGLPIIGNIPDHDNIGI